VVKRVPSVNKNQVEFSFSLFQQSRQGKLGFHFDEVKIVDLRFRKMPAWVKDTFGWILQTVLRPIGTKGFVVLPKRWIVERTFAWLARYRRHSKDYERTTESSETMIYLSMIALMSRRLALEN